MSEFIAAIGSAQYESVQAAVDAAKLNDVIVLLDNTTENIVIPKDAVITLDLNGKTLSGGTDTIPEHKDKPAILNNGTITIKDTSDEKTGMIKRDDVDADSTSYYVISNQGIMNILSGTIYNDSGHVDPEKRGGSSLICNGDEPDPEQVYESDYAKLYIKGGRMHQDNFIAIKNGSKGFIEMTGGVIDSANESAIQNWHHAIITGGTVNGLIWAFAYDANGDSDTKLGSNVTVNGKIWSQNYSETGTKKATIEINGGKYNLVVDNGKPGPALDAKAGGTIAISDGRFNLDPTPYLTKNAKITRDLNGNFTVAKRGVMIAIKPKYPTHRVTKKALINEDDFVNIIEIQSSRIIHYLLDTAFIAIVLDGKFYPVDITNCDEQVALVLADKELTIEEDTNFGIMKLTNFVSKSISDDAAKVMRNAEFYINSANGECINISDFTTVGIDAVTNNGYWICFNMDLEKAKEVGYSDMKIYGTDTDVVNGDNFINVNYNTTIGITANITVNKDGVQITDAVDCIFKNNLKFTDSKIDIDPRA